MRQKVFAVILGLAASLLVSQPTCNQKKFCPINGQTRACYTGPKGTKGVGLCQAGKQTCVKNQWSVCRGQVLPQKEVCDDDLDQNCDGADKACPCDDGKCEGKESLDSCPQDCPGTCGDGICNEYFETASSCDQDCPGSCGDGICNTYYENQTNCLTDCPMEDDCEPNNDEASACFLANAIGLSPVTGCTTGVANDDDYYSFYSAAMTTYGEASIYSQDSSGEVNLCTGIGPFVQSCNDVSGNNELIEVALTLSNDVWVEVHLVSGNTVSYKLCWYFETICGDGYCNHALFDCADDCDCMNNCGNGLCSYYCNEEYNCPWDCGLCICGNGLCEKDCYETRQNCPKDCR